MTGVSATGGPADATSGLRDWIVADLRSVRDRLARGVVDAIPAERWHERVDGGGIAPVSVAWHVARHHDVATCTGVQP